MKYCFSIFLSHEGLETSSLYTGVLISP